MNKKGKKLVFNYLIILFYFYYTPLIAETNKSNEIDNELLQSIAGAVVTAMAAKENQETPNKDTNNNTPSPSTESANKPASTQVSTSTSAPTTEKKPNNTSTQTATAEKTPQNQTETTKALSDIKKVVQTAVPTTDSDATKTDSASTTTAKAAEPAQNKAAEPAKQTAENKSEAKPAAPEKTADNKTTPKAAEKKSTTAAASTEKSPPPKAKIPAVAKKIEHFNTILVQSGDSLQNIAVRLYGRNDRYLEIYELNRDIIKNPNIVPAGEILRVRK